jgi:TolB-like protein
MKLKISMLLLIFISCNTPQPKIFGESLIDEAVHNLKNQLILNYKIVDKRTLAIASFTRVDLITMNRKYNVAVSELGENIANSLQNEIFNPELFDLLERQRIDGIIGESLFSQQGLSDDNLSKISLSGAEYIILGTMQKRENSIRIDARIVELKSGKILSVANTNLKITPYILDSYNNLRKMEQESERFEIVSNEGWQATKVIINEPSEIEIFAEGQWSMTSARIERMNPEGLPQNPSNWGDYRLFSNFNHGALICRIKIDKEQEYIFTLGEKANVQPGLVECRINDKDFGNNVGSVFVTIKHKILISKE